MTLEGELTDESKLLFMLWGVTRFDGQFVANALRTNSLSPLGIEALAKLLEGSHPKGFRLDFAGRGRNEPTLLQIAERVNRAEQIVLKFDALRSMGESYEVAVEMVASEFDVSEATISRELGHFGDAVREEGATVTPPDA